MRSVKLCPSKHHSVYLLIYLFIYSFIKTNSSGSISRLDYGLNDRGSISGRVWEFFRFSTVSRSALGSTQPPVQWVSRVPSLGVKVTGREATNSPPYTAKFKNAWTYTSIPQYVWYLVNTGITLHLLPLNTFSILFLEMDSE
jgi:hypothetical protein